MGQIAKLNGIIIWKLYIVALSYYFAYTAMTGNTKILLGDCDF